MDADDGIDLSPLHRELDRLKTRLCRCDHKGECLDCRGFEVLRQQSQMVVAAASQPVLMQVAQEAAMRDMMAQLTGAGEKLTHDPRLQELVSELMERVQEQLGGPEGLKRMFGGLGGMPGFGDLGGGGAGGETPPEGGTGRSDEERPRRDIPWDDRPPGDRDRG